jgi:hypothetical protein
MKTLIHAASGALLVATLSVTSHAAALDLAAGFMITEARSTSAVDKVADKRCWARNGVRHCRENTERRRSNDSAQNGYGYSYGAPRAEFYPAGSAAWWHAMEREGRTANPPN